MPDNVISLTDGGKAVAEPAAAPPRKQALQSLRFGPPWEPDSYASTAIVEILDRATHAAIGRATMGLSPGALAAAYLDWATHLAFSPGKQMQLAQKAQKKYARLMNYALRCAANGGGECAIEPLPQDRRFDSEDWRQWPFNLMSQSFLLTQQWWHNATTGLAGVTPQHERVVEFASRQLLDIVAPTNFVATNPEVLKKAIETNGASLMQGWRNFIEDAERAASGRPPVGAEAFEVGKNVAATPGKVVYRNRLMELIQYDPSTPAVFREPVLITPAWIMKYYILDLSAHNSLVRHLVENGHTVFMISWKNPGQEDRNISLDDYRDLGVMAALDAIEQATDGASVHGVGYCLGGTLLGIAAAAMAGVGDERFKTLSFLASQFDFTEAGELTLFINESQVAFLEDVMWEQGFLDAKQMAGAFQLLRSNDLVWSRVQRDYLMGERQPMTDLMAWNADATRMPYAMHAEYLRSLFLNNDLAEGRYRVHGRPVAISDIRAPMFCVATERDHVAPWRSAFKVHLLADTDVDFVLVSGGHNGGIVSEPGRPRRHYRIRHAGPDDLFLDPETWLAETLVVEGSWWPAWCDWLATHSGERVDPLAMQWVEVRGRDDGVVGAPLTPAPGSYVHMQ
ncbi:MAG: PHA/PHB synthase family protein [Hyphococcus sp.]